jgi:hypothetical protein
VQLFSNEELTLRMTEKLHLLHIIVYSIKSMMSSVLTLNTLGDVQQNYHEVVDCGEHVMKEWQFNQSVALQFFFVLEIFLLADISTVLCFPQELLYRV